MKTRRAKITALPTVVFALQALEFFFSLTNNNPSPYSFHSSNLKIDASDVPGELLEAGALGFLDDFWLVRKRLHRRSAAEA